jgi:hypothetical protein
MVVQVSEFSAHIGIDWADTGLEVPKSVLEFIYIH